MNISPSDTFWKTLLLERYLQNSLAIFGLYGHEWVKVEIVTTAVDWTLVSQPNLNNTYITQQEQ